MFKFKKMFIPVIFSLVTCVMADDSCFTRYERVGDIWSQDIYYPFVSYSSFTDDSPEMSLHTRRPVFLHKESEVAFHAVNDNRPENTEGLFYGGLARIKVAEDGVYRVYLSNRTWVDFTDFETATLVEPEGYLVQEECPSIKKMIEFKLVADVDYVLQLSSSTEPLVNMMIFKVDE
ncbi:MAG: hypothetical protein OXB84_06040 [Halobacteriovoraceae bacterium]|nr:hypothetical protein [Halobacteriovoraceae bacterium]